MAWVTTEPRTAWSEYRESAILIASRLNRMTRTSPTLREIHRTWRLYQPLTRAMWSSYQRATLASKACMLSCAPTSIGRRASASGSGGLAATAVSAQLRSAAIASAAPAAASTASAATPAAFADRRELRAARPVPPAAVPTPASRKWPGSRMSVRASANVWPAIYDGSARRWAFVSLALPACAGGLASVAELATSGWFMICATRAGSVLSGSVLSGLRRHSPKSLFPSTNVRTPRSRYSARRPRKRDTPSVTAETAAAVMPKIKTRPIAVCRTRLSTVHPPPGGRRACRHRNPTTVMPSIPAQQCTRVRAGIAVDPVPWRQAFSLKSRSAAISVTSIWAFCRWPE